MEGQLMITEFWVNFPFKEDTKKLLVHERSWRLYQGHTHD